MAQKEREQFMEIEKKGFLGAKKLLKITSMIMSVTILLGLSKYKAYADAPPVTVYSSGWIDSEYLVSKGTTSLSGVSGNGTDSKGYTMCCVLDVTNIKTISISGGTSRSLSFDAGGDTSISFKVGSVDIGSGGSIDVSALAGNLTIQIYGQGRSWGPHQKENSYQNYWSVWLSNITVYPLLDLELTASPSSWCNTDVEVTALGTGIPIEGYSNDGINYTNNNVFTITENGTYSFYTKAENGTVLEKQITINYIDRNKPEIKSIAYGTKKTAKSVSINITAEDK